MVIMSYEEPLECPLCMEPLEVDDVNFYPCCCGYQICRFCWHRIRTDENGLCPACRAQYSEHPADFKPLTEEEVQRIKRASRQKDQQKKQKTADSRKHLANLRVVQRNLVFVVGLPPRLSDPEILKKHEYFGKFGKIMKVVINHSTAYAGSQLTKQGPSAGAYVTYFRSEDALRALEAVNNVHVDGRTLKASLGTTKYCSHFLKGSQCPKSDCMYLHDLGEEAASFTKEHMQQGKHFEYEQALREQFRLTQQQLLQQQVLSTSLPDSQKASGPSEAASSSSHQQHPPPTAPPKSSKEVWPSLHPHKTHHRGGSDGSGQNSTRSSASSSNRHKQHSESDVTEPLNPPGSSVPSNPRKGGCQHKSPSPSQSSSNPTQTTPRSKTRNNNGKSQHQQRNQSSSGATSSSAKTQQQHEGGGGKGKDKSKHKSSSSSSHSKQHQQQQASQQHQQSSSEAKKKAGEAEKATRTEASATVTTTTTTAHDNNTVGAPPVPVEATENEPSPPPVPITSLTPPLQSSTPDPVIQFEGISLPPPIEGIRASGGSENIPEAATSGLMPQQVPLHLQPLLYGDNSSVFSSHAGFFGAVPLQPSDDMLQGSGVAELPDTIPVNTTTDWQQAFGLALQQQHHHHHQQDVLPSFAHDREDDLGFDPWSESSKGLQDLLVSESLTSSTNDLGRASPLSSSGGLPSHHPHAMNSPVAPPPGFAPPGFGVLPPPPHHVPNHGLSLGGDMSSVQQQSQQQRSGGDFLFNHHHSGLGTTPPPPGLPDISHPQADAFSMQDWQDSLRAVLPNANIHIGSRLPPPSSHPLPQATSSEGQSPLESWQLQDNAIVSSGPISRDCGGEEPHWLRSIQQLTEGGDSVASPLPSSSSSSQPMGLPPSLRSVWSNPPAPTNPPPGFRSQFNNHPFNKGQPAHEIAEGLN